MERFGVLHGQNGQGDRQGGRNPNVIRARKNLVDTHSDKSGDQAPKDQVSGLSGWTIGHAKKQYRTRPKRTDEK